VSVTAAAPRARGSRAPALGEGWAQTALLLALLAWGLVPVVLMAIHAVSAGERLTGADGLIGADQLQYLAWARDAGVHGLAANLFSLAPSGHVFAQPLFTITGLLWRLGLPLTLAYWLWKPVAVVVLFAGTVACMNRAFEGARRQSLAAAILALFILTPVASLLAWVTIGSAPFRTGVLQLGAEMFSASELWGYLPSAIAIGLLPVVLLAVERGLAAGPGDLRASRGWLVTVASASALLASWLHPWQGLILILILVSLLVWNRGRGLIAIAAPAVAAALPLAYYAALAHFDSAWHLASHAELVPRPSLGVLFAALAPLVAVGCAGLRRPGDDQFERALLLWIPAGLVTYALNGSFPTHAFESLSIPFAVFAVRAWRRVGLSPLVGALALAAVTLPGMVYVSRSFYDIATGPAQAYYLTSSEAHALDWIAAKAPAGGALAPPGLSAAIPSQTDRPVWYGHVFWSTDYATRARQASALFSGALAPATASSLLAHSGASLVVSDCAHRRDLGPLLRPILSAVHRFGCAAVYVIRR
jgi:hypothetical protein